MAIEESSKVIRKWFTEHDWTYDKTKLDDGLLLFTTGVAAGSPIFDGYDISIICRERDVQSTFTMPVKAMQKRYAPVAEYLMRVNDRFRRGKWTLDYADGEICFSIVKDSEAVEADTDVAMDDLIGFAECVCDGFAEGVVQVIAGAKTPAQAYEDAVARDDADADNDNEGDACNLASKSPENGVTPTKAKRRKGKKRSGSAKSSQSKGCMPVAPTSELPRWYSLEGLNVEGKVSLPDVVAAIGRFNDVRCKDVDAPRMSILLSGAPGTGKTAFARYLASQVGMKLITVRASDILGCHVGETEKQIDKVFADAKKQDAILFLDEIDGILGNRRNAERIWEVSQTNQLLQCMESFGGVLIAATNLVDRLDEAVMRRFTYKLKLSYLTDVGKSLFFKRYFSTPLTDAQQKRLNSIESLTPGDFRTVREGLYYLVDKQTNEARLDALEAESAARHSPKRIGF